MVAGVVGLYRRDRVLAVGGFDPRMATEDIDLTWKLLIAGWETVYEPRALVGMQVPSTLGALWAQRKRWARGQGEVLHVHLREVSRLRNHRMWLLSLEAVASLLWIIALAASLVVAALGVAIGGDDLPGFAISWGIAVALVATAQTMVALTLDHAYDPTSARAFLLAAVYPLAYWLIAAAAAIHSEVVALVRGPRTRRVVWDVPRAPVDAEGASGSLARNS